jgi:hypothetical protein
VKPLQLMPSHVLLERTAHSSQHRNLLSAVQQQLQVPQLLAVPPCLPLPAVPCSTLPASAGSAATAAAIADQLELCHVLLIAASRSLPAAPLCCIHVQQLFTAVQQQQLQVPQLLAVPPCLLLPAVPW